MTHTKQSVFDTVARGILAQGGPALSENDLPSCVYRGAKGIKCGIGMLIPDSEYTDNMEGQDVINALGFSFALTNLAENVSINFLEQLQVAHDDAGSSTIGWLDNWKEPMRNIAVSHDLDTASLNG
jgi:hypothetical protein